MRKLLVIVAFAIASTILLFALHLLNYPTEYKSAILNIFQGVYASIIIVLAIEFNQKLKLFRRLNKLEGLWEEFGIENRFLKGPIASGKIRYNGGNSLYIELRHDSRMWSGEIIINKDHPHSGIISWSYHPDTGQEHEFGLKELIIPTERNRNDSEYIFLYLIPVNFTDGFLGELRQDNTIYVGPYGYGKVVWRKKK